MLEEYYHLQSLADEACEPDKLWRERALRNDWVCSQCLSPIEHTLPEPILLSQYPADVPLNILVGTGLGVISKAFIEDLGRQEVLEQIETTELLVTGREVPLAHFFAFRERSVRVLIRGNEASIFRKCEICQTVLYFPRGRWYVLEQDLRARLPLYCLQIGILVREDLLKRISRKKYTNLSIVKMKLLSDPRDRLPKRLLGD